MMYQEVACECEEKLAIQTLGALKPLLKKLSPLMTSFKLSGGTRSEHMRYWSKLSIKDTHKFDHIQ